MHDELYTFRGDDMGKMSKNTICLWKNNVYERFDAPDRGTPSVNGRTRFGEVASLNRPASPLRFLFLPKLIFSAHYYLDQDCKTSGWEVVDDRNCLRVDFSQGSLKESYWVDVQRGANPLKFEFSVNVNLRMRTDRVQLAHVPDQSGKLFCLPVSGVHETFLMKELTYSKTPIFTESFKVLDGGLKINQGLPDRRFSWDWTSAPQTELLKQAKKEIAAKRRPAMDPASTDARLKGLLKVADEQSKQLQASSPTRESGSWVAASLAVVGVSVLSIAGVKTYRARS